MSELAIVAIVLMAVSLIIYVIVKQYNRHMAAEAGPQQWTLDEETIAYGDQSFVSIKLKREHLVPITIGTVGCDRADFEDAIIELRVKAEDRAAILNRRLNP